MMKQFLLKKRLIKDIKSFKRSKQFEHYVDLKRFVLMCAYENLQDVLQYRDLLFTDRKEVQIICFYSGKQKELPAIPDGVDFWTIKQLHSFGTLDPHLIEKYIAYKADVYVNLSIKQNFLFEHFLMQVKPNYWTGFRSSNADFGDLMLETNDATPFANLVEQMHFYLKTIRTK